MIPHDAHADQQDADFTPDSTRSVSIRDALALILAEFPDRPANKPSLCDALDRVAQWLTVPDTVTDGAVRDCSGAGRERASEDSRIQADLPARGDSSRPRHSDVCDNDLSLIAERCRLKAEGARWAVERDELLRDGADFSFDVRPGDQDVIGRARQLPNCFLWMNQPRSDIWSRAENYLLLADCFETLAECVDALLATAELDDRSQFMAAVDMTAEAQSALRTAVSRVESHPDSDQQMVYYWLRNRANQERFYISRFMKISDPADPGRNDDVHDRAFELLEEIAPEQHLASQVERGMARARHHIDRIASAEDVSDEYDWARAADAIEAVIECGIACDSEELVDLIRPYADQLTGQNWPQGFQELLAAAAQGSDDDGASQTERAA